MIKATPRSYPTAQAILPCEEESTLGWERFIGRKGVAIGIDRFGASANFKDIVQVYGFSKEAVAQTLYNLQVIQYGLFLGANQQINALLSPKNSASFQATLEANLAYANRQLADLKKVNPSL